MRLERQEPAVVEAALGRVRDGAATRSDLKLLTKHFLAVLEERAPGRSVEVRVPPYAATQVVPGVRHTRGTPPAVVEMDPRTWIDLATGATTFTRAEQDGRLVASGERTDLSSYLPVHPAQENGDDAGDPDSADDAGR